MQLPPMEPLVPTSSNPRGNLGFPPFPPSAAEGYPNPGALNPLSLSPITIGSSAADVQGSGGVPRGSSGQLPASFAGTTAPRGVPGQMPPPTAGFPQFGGYPGGYGNQQAEFGFGQHPATAQPRGHWNEFSGTNPGATAPGGGRGGPSPRNAAADISESRLPAALSQQSQVAAQGAGGIPRFVDGTIELSAGAPVFVPKFAPPAPAAAAAPPTAPLSFSAASSSAPPAATSGSTLFPTSPSLSGHSLGGLASAGSASLWGPSLSSGPTDPLGLGSGVGIGEGSLGLGLGSGGDLWNLGGAGNSSSLDSSSHFSAFLSNPLSSSLNSLGSGSLMSGGGYGSTLAGLRGDSLGLGGLGDSSLSGGGSSLLSGVGVGSRGNSEASLMSHFNSNSDFDYLSRLAVDHIDDGVGSNSHVSKLMSQFVDGPGDLSLLGGSVGGSSKAGAGMGGVGADDMPGLTGLSRSFT
jgi:hypothetical protein